MKEVFVRNASHLIYDMIIGSYFVKSNATRIHSQYNVLYYEVEY